MRFGSIVLLASAAAALVGLAALADAHLGDWTATQRVPAPPAHDVGSTAGPPLGASRQANANWDLAFASSGAGSPRMPSAASHGAALGAASGHQQATEDRHAALEQRLRQLRQRQQQQRQEEREQRHRQQEEQSRPWSASVFMASALAVLVMAGNMSSAWASSESMAAVAPCLLSQCQIPLAKCITNPQCAANLTCIIGCTASPDEKSCQIKCGDQFENDVVVEFNECALTSKKCVPRRPDTGPLPGQAGWTPGSGRYPVPPPESITKEFNVEKMTGRWYISAGLNPLFDTFDCQVHFFQGLPEEDGDPARLLGKINWRIREPDGEFLNKTTIQRFVQTAPGVLENHGNAYLNYQDDWYVLDHDYEDDPDLGFVLIYYRGQNDAWAGYGGGTLYTRSRYPDERILSRVRGATARANVPFDQFWKVPNNSCYQIDDPLKFRSRFATKVLEGAETTAVLGVEEQLTLLARSAYSRVRPEEEWINEGAAKIKKMRDEFIAQENFRLKKIEETVDENTSVLQRAFKWVQGALPNGKS